MFEIPLVYPVSLLLGLILLSLFLEHSRRRLTARCAELMSHVEDHVERAKATTDEFNLFRVAARNK